MATDAVVFRPGTEADLPALTEIYNHYVRTTAISFDIEPFTVEARRSWFAHYGQTGRHRLLVAVSVDGSVGPVDGPVNGPVNGSAVLGYATSSQFRVRAAYDTSVETTVYCRPASAGRGIGSTLYQHLFDALAAEDVHRAYAGIALPNEASVRLHLKMGFTEVGVYSEVGRKQGRYWDVLWLERPLP